MKIRKLREKMFYNIFQRIKAYFHLVILWVLTAHINKPHSKNTFSLAVNKVQPCPKWQFCYGDYLLCWVSLCWMSLCWVSWHLVFNCVHSIYREPPWLWPWFVL